MAQQGAQTLGLPRYQPLRPSVSLSNCALVENASKKLYGVQFHPEVDLSVEGSKMLRILLYGVVV